jgi:hypothetical protein
MRDIRAVRLGGPWGLAGISLGAMLIAAGPAAAQTATSIFTFSGANWNDGGGISGYVAFDYNITSGAITQVDSVDITTGNGTSDGFAGYTYSYNVPSLTNSSTLGVGGSPAGILSQQIFNTYANELTLTGTDANTHELVLDWQGDTPGSLYVGSLTTGIYSQEYYSGSPGVRNVSAQDGGSGGSGSTAVTEPSTMLVMATGLVALAWLRRRRI